MSLYHVNYHKKCRASTLEKNENVSMLKARVHPKTWEKMVRIFDEQIQAVSPSEKSSLTFAMLATLVGYNSKAPTTDTNFVWTTVDKAARGHPRVANYMLGCLAQWRFALDDRPWLAFKQETGTKNEIGEEIQRTSYWVKQ